MTKKSIFEGTGGVQKIAQKHGQNVIFSFCTEEKEDKKWSKSAQIQGVGQDRQNAPLSPLFVSFLCFW